VTKPQPPDPIEADREWLVNQIAHALRNPIFAASVQAEALQLRRNDPQAMLETADNLRAQLQRLSANIDEMLLFGRPIELDPEELSVAELVETIAGRYRAGDRQDPAAVVTLAEVDPDLVAFWDRRAVTVILERLLDNAVQHTDEPHDIELGVGAGQDSIELTVRDRGEGIGPSILDSAKLPFFPQHSGRPGLGLAIADKFTRALGGTLTIDSSEGLGTTVRIVVPIRVSR
jgi:signal transduction histidine kinase